MPRPPADGQRDLDLRLAHRGEVGEGELPAGNFGAVLPEDRLAAEIPAPFGHGAVFEDKPEIRRSRLPGGEGARLLHPDGAVGLLDLIRHRLPGEVGQHDAVVGHVGRVLPLDDRLAEISAVGEELLPVRRLSHQRFVLPVPDIAALEPGIPLEQIAEFFHPAAAARNLIEVFDQDDGPAVGGIRQHLEDGIDRRVHVPPDVRDIFSGLARFVLAEAGGVVLLDEAVHRRMVGAGAALVAERPGIDGGVVLVIGRHPHRALQKLARPGRVVGERAHDAVGLNVALTDEQQPQLVAEVVPLRAVWIVAGADRVDVHPLHLPDLLDHMGAADRPSALPAEIVPVDPADDEPLAVEMHDPVDDLDLLEADAAALPVAFRPVRADQGYGRPVKGRGFGRPELHLRESETHPPGICGGEAVGPVLGGRHDRAFPLGELFPVQVVEGKPHPAVGKPGLAGYADVGCDLAAAPVQVGQGGDLVVLDAEGGLGDQPDVPVDAGEVPVILILEVAALGKAEHRERNRIFARPEESGHPELGGELAVLRVARRLTVDPEVKGGLHPLKAQIDLLAREIFGQGEASAVTAGGVLRRDKGRVGELFRCFERRADHLRAGGLVVPRVGDVGVDRLAESLQLPAPRHRDGGEAAKLRAFPVKIPDIFRGFLEPELPLPV